MEPANVEWRQAVYDGKLVNNNYEKDGQMIYQTEVRVSGIYLLPKKVQEEDEPRMYRNSRK